MSLKRILLCKEKHEDNYWDASDDESWAKSSLAILTDRWNDDFWYQKPEKPSQGGLLTKKQIDALPDGRVKEVALKELKNYEESLKSFIDENDWYERASKIVEQQNLSFVKYKNRASGKIIRQLPLAYELLTERNSYEYEEVELIEVRTVE